MRTLPGQMNFPNVINIAIFQCNSRERSHLRSAGAPQVPICGRLLQVVLDQQAPCPPFGHIAADLLSPHPHLPFLIQLNN